ncbi:MAG: hypothetical protein UY76_C0054G0005 [Candidatus Uhrbacteria bacterium GW2011_GWA2_52_8d]|uniref:Uncharacterized protein n=1 Tax=Candidatus Uhrbacteria bacterium GW2011_GWA2_52_8d TaxID=1618979 RepID=A0A0G1XLA3_9BACT|nr:MAG: hypothetical protein UY76_C0054G0005 [Candidatus Uhrbacteria bacterium GW2011_GWA2_52_8d]
MPTALGAVLTLRFANSRRLFLVKKLGKPETEDTTIDPGDHSMTCIVNPTGGSSGTNWLVLTKEYETGTIIGASEPALLRDATIVPPPRAESPA